VITLRGKKKRGLDVSEGGLHWVELDGRGGGAVISASAFEPVPAVSEPREMRTDTIESPFPILCRPSCPTREKLLGAPFSIAYCKVILAGYSDAAFPDGG